MNIHHTRNTYSPTYYFFKNVLQNPQLSGSSVYNVVPDVQRIISLQVDGIRNWEQQSWLLHISLWNIFLLYCQYHDQIKMEIKGFVRTEFP